MWRLILLLSNIIVAQEMCGEYSDLSSQHYFPWIAVLKSTVNKTKEGKDKFICNSSIISQQFSILAAHCIHAKHSFYKRSHSEIYLLASIHDLKHAEQAQKILIKNIFLQNEWNHEIENYDGDLALLKFENNLMFNDNLMPICLWHNQTILESTGVVISFTDPEEDEPGYFNYEHDPNHNFAQRFIMPIRNECVESQPRFEAIASNRTFCAGGFNSGRCLEVGNSGSSIAVKIENKHYLRGIVSASFIDFAGCDNFTYSLFTDVLKFRDWIDQTISNTTVVLHTTQ